MSLLLTRLSRRALRAGAHALVGMLPVVATAIAPGVAGAAGTSVPNVASALVAIAPAPALPAATVSQGPLGGATQVSGTIVFEPHNQAAFTAFLGELSDPRSPLYHHYLAPGQFGALFGPSTDVVTTTRALLKGAGLNVTNNSRDPLVMDFRGKAAEAEAAFHTGLEKERLPGGSMGRATTGPIRLPASVAGSVVAVVGLDDLVHLRSGALRRSLPLKASSAKGASAGGARSRHGVTDTPVACPAAAALGAIGGISDTQVAEAYGFEGLYSAGDLAAHETVDLFELQPFITSDIATFDECYFGESHTSQVVRTYVDGGAGSGPGDEAELDIENISALAPGAHIDVFEAPNSTWGSLDEYADIVNTDNARVVSTSWGLCEEAFQVGAPGTQQAENEIFEQAAAQGQTIFAAAGDDGSDDCANQAPTPSAPDLSIDDPGSQPYVTDVGGTTFESTTEPPDEIAWNDGPYGGGGGGGISETWAMPAWQLDSGAPGVADNTYTRAGGGTDDEPCSNDPGGSANIYHVAGFGTTLPSGTLCREIPDVSALADEITGISTYIALEGAWEPSGGTSSAAPIWAAATAEVDASSWCSGSPDGVGFLSPLLYQLAANPTDYADSFNNVGKAAGAGNNDSLSIPAPPGTTAPPFPATAGYNMATGLGTPRLTNVSHSTPGLAELACQAALSSTRPAASGLSKDYSALAGGSDVTITGAGFGTAQGHVLFGDAVVSDVVSWSDTSLEVEVPPYVAPEGSPSANGGPVDVTVVDSAGLSSEPSGRAVFHYIPATSPDEPVVNFVGPSGGPANPKNPKNPPVVTIYGSGFKSGTSGPTVTFGGSAATVVKVLSDSEMTVTPPPENSGACAPSSDASLCQEQVVVAVDGVSSQTSTILPPATGEFQFNDSGQVIAPPGCDCELVAAQTEYDYVTPPTITSVSPAYGDANGGTVETIDGSGFDLLTLIDVTFGPAGSQLGETYPSAITPDQIQVAIPPSLSSAGVEPTAPGVAVQTISGTALAPRYPAAGSFAYAGIPVVSALSAHYGPTSGGGTITISGRGFSDADEVSFVSRVDQDLLPPAVTDRLSGTDTSIKVVVPADFEVPTDAEVCSPTGCSSADPAVDLYTFAYPGQPTVTSFTPATGPAQGGSTVTISGTLLSEAIAVYFGSVASPSFHNDGGFPSGDNPNEVVAEAPPGLSGSKVSITVATVGGEVVGKPKSNPTSETFDYANSPPSAPLSVAASVSGDTVTVTWKAPASDGGSPITSYDLAATSRGEPSVNKSVGPTDLKEAFTGLKTGVDWVISVMAVSKFGKGLAASSKPVKPA